MFVDLSRNGTREQPHPYTMVPGRCYVEATTGLHSFTTITLRTSAVTLDDTALCPACHEQAPVPCTTLLLLLALCTHEYYRPREYSAHCSRFISLVSHVTVSVFDDVERDCVNCAAVPWRHGNRLTDLATDYVSERTPHLFVCL
ncbi:hypothetical protein J6590_030501 [Homalodisca vitripennis]|nr:hypothetical protein J6590_030501 [Homalodisca vitripennis]